MSKTAQQIKNLEEALVWWQTVPEANVFPHLARWVKGSDTAKVTATDCNTVACFGGWCARWPGLVAQGVGLDSDGWPAFNGQIGASVARSIFGDFEMFLPRYDHDADQGFKGSDHALVTNRIRWALEH